MSTEVDYQGLKSLLEKTYGVYLWAALSTCSGSQVDQLTETSGSLNQLFEKLIFLLGGNEDAAWRILRFALKSS
ncbi:MAG: hypothetical protein DRJ98_06295 [Thermoprotei archaeon]|nr:MAG: hypothetical protein DRJ98_06295 [Thermoprotei archaeon]